MSKPSQGLRALAAMLETVTPELSAAAAAAAATAAASLHQAADAEASVEAASIGGPVAGSVLASFATAMIDGFFGLLRIGSAPPAPATAGPVAG